jgi:hypothetical protein
MVHKERKYISGLCFFANYIWTMLYSLRSKLLVVLAFLYIYFCYVSRHNYISIYIYFCYVSRHNYISRCITKEMYLEKKTTSTQGVLNNLNKNGIHNALQIFALGVRSKTN